MSSDSPVAPALTASTASTDFGQIGSEVAMDTFAADTEAAVDCIEAACEAWRNSEGCVPCVFSPPS